MNNRRAVGRRLPGSQVPTVQKGAQESPIFWRVTEDTEMYSGPGGVPTSLISEGAVVHEQFRYIDSFDKLWIATGSEDGTTVWFAPFCDSNGQPCGGNEEEDAHWEATTETVDETVPPKVNILLEATQKLSNLHLTNRPHIPRHTDSLEFSLELISLYWESVFQVDAPSPQYKDWNLLYVQAVESALYTKSETSYTPLQTVLSEFVSSVEDNIPSLISDMFLPSGRRKFQSVKSKNNSSVAYFRDGIAFTLGIDHGGERGGDECAMKGQSQCYHASQYLADIAPKYGVHTPLTLLMTYGGFRIQASSIPPVRLSHETMLIEGSSTLLPEGISSDVAKSKFASELVSLIAREARLDANLTQAPYPFTVVAGCDCRLYAVDVCATLPCFAPPRKHRIYKSSVHGHFWRLRPEVLGRMQGGLSCHAFLEGPTAGTTDKNTEQKNTAAAAFTIEESEAAIEVATQWLRDDVIPTVANVLGLIEPCIPSLNLPTVECKNCLKVVTSQELRFLVCRGDDRCCYICPQCYINIVSAAVEEERESENDEAVDGNGNEGESEEKSAAAERAPVADPASPSVAEQLAKCVKCDCGVRSLRALELQPDVGTLFHAYGLNLRFMASVYHRIPLSAKPLMCHFLEIEMVSRAAKHVLWRRLRHSNADPETIPTICEEFLSALLQPEGAVAEALWGNEVGPAIQTGFDVFIPFDTEHLDVSLVYERISELTGLEVTDESFEKLLNPAKGLTLKLAQMTPVMKTLRMPVFGSCEVFDKTNEEGEEESEVSERVSPKEFLDSVASKMLLLWAGVQDSVRKDLFDKYTSHQPFYLQE